MPKVYNKKWKDAPKDAVYIGRGSMFGNPFKMEKESDRDKCCELYEEYVESDPVMKELFVELLRGKDLLCFCYPRRCHGDYLLRICNS